MSIIDTGLEDTMALAAFIRHHMSSWEETQLDDNARLRNNLILFTFTISCAFCAFNIATVAFAGIEAAVVGIALNVLTIVLFLWQFFTKNYSFACALLFGIASLGMAVYFISSSNSEGAYHLLIYVFPIIGTLVVSLPFTIAYNGTLLTMLVVLFWTPVYDIAGLDYSSLFRTYYPITVLLVVICDYVAFLAQQRAHKKLVATNEKLKDSAFTDPLTGAYNRRALTAQIGPMDETAYGLSFAMLDLDHFKRVNDTFGHDVGDKALCHVVAIIKRNIPANALLYRWGGEEFLLVLKTTDPDEAYGVFEHIRADIEHSPLLTEEAPEGHVSLTISIGGYCPQDKEETLEPCINRADSLLFKAKDSGRNRVEFASSR